MYNDWGRTLIYFIENLESKIILQRYRISDKTDQLILRELKVYEDIY